MTFFRVFGFAALIVCIGFVSSVEADFVTGVIASTDAGEFNPDFEISNIVDGSGLSSLDFSATHDVTDGFGAGDNHWATNQDTGLFFPFNLDFDLGSVLNIDSIAIWNGVNDPGLIAGGLRDIQIFASDDGVSFGPAISASVNGATSDTNIVLNPALGGPGNPADILSFETVSARFFRIAVSTAQDTDFFVGVGEVGFNSVIPEPSSAVLISTILLATVCRRKRS